jgi:ATP synthase protein I
MRKAAPYLGLGWAFVAPMILGLVAGFYLDRWLGTEPWLLLAGLLLGMGAGFLALYGVILRLKHDEEQRRKDGR